MADTGVAIFRFAQTVVAGVLRQKESIVYSQLRRFDHQVGTRFGGGQKADTFLVCIACRWSM